MKAVVPFHIDMSDDTTAHEFDEAVQAARLAFALAAMRARIGKITWKDSPLADLPEINCNQVRGRAS